MLDLVLDGTLTTELVALLWTCLARRASVVVAAGPGGAGKTTLLTALLDLLPAGTRRVYVRGCYESFTFLSDPDVDPRTTCLLVNEISAHLPIYLWGRGVRRVLGLARDGYVVAATAHATSVEDLVGELVGYPLRVPTAEIAALDLVVLLDAWEEEGAVHRQVSAVATLVPTAGGGLRVDQLAARPTRAGPVALDISLVDQVIERLTGEQHIETLRAELDERAAALDRLVASPVPPSALPAVLRRLDARWPKATKKRRDAER